LQEIASQFNVKAEDLARVGIEELLRGRMKRSNKLPNIFQ
jgi:hypothetical protein